VAKADRSSWLLRIDRRFVYLFVLLALMIPFLFPGLTTKPAPLPSAKKLFDKVERIARERDEAVAEGRPYNKVVLLSFDFGPQTRAELYPMAEAMIRHLMMRKIKFAVMTHVPDGAGYCEDIPNQLAREFDDIDYGRDYVNFGYKVGRTFLIKQMGEDMAGALKTDVKGTPYKDIKCLKGVQDAGDVALMTEITGLVGFAEMWIQFFASARARPDIGHGCTSVSIPDAFDMLESKLIIGLLEGIAGAAAYNEFIEEIRSEDQPPTSPKARVHMTGQTVAHLLLVLFVLLGNVGVIMSALRRRKVAGS